MLWQVSIKIDWFSGKSTCYLSTLTPVDVIDWLCPLDWARFDPIRGRRDAVRRGNGNSTLLCIVKSRNDVQLVSRIREKFLPGKKIRNKKLKTDHLNLLGFSKNNVGILFSTAIQNPKYI